MRPIKFRAYDKQAEQMYYSDQQYDEAFFEFKNGNPYCFIIYEAPGTLYEPPHPQSQELDNIMEFTGLLDKNGDEIWEGDILSGHADGNVVVAWHGTGWECDFSVNSEAAIGLDELCLWFGNPAIIIGNIYEHPELLEGK